MMLSQQVNLNLLEGVAHHCNENVDKNDNDGDQVRCKHDLTNLLDVHTAVEVCTEH